MTNVLLINTPIYSAKRDPEAGTSVPPIGIGYLYTQLVLSGYECSFIDAFVDSMLPDEIVDSINVSNSEYIGLNIFSSNYTIVRHIVENVEPKRNFLIGGPAARTLVSEIKTWNSRNNITVMIGEAELFISDYIQHPKEIEKITSNLGIVTITPESPYFPYIIDLPLDRWIFRCGGAAVPVGGEPVFQSCGATVPVMEATRIMR